MPELAGLSPMMQQYFAIKNQHRDKIVFFRLGDFYEMFFDDAMLVSKELELTLTGRDCGLEERAPMCGVPYHSYENYVARLIQKGYKVAICEQMENPALAKGVVRREIVRIVTPGTLMEPNLLDEGSNNYICCIYLQDQNYGLAFADISTGEVHLTAIAEGAEGENDGKLQNELGRFAPSEVIFNSAFLTKTEMAAFIKDRICCTADLADDDAFAQEAAAARVKAHLCADDLSAKNLTDPLLICCFGGLLQYLSQTQRVGLERLMTIDLYAEAEFMKLDTIARRNLEITETLRSRERRGSLLWVMDKTRTAMGKRLIKNDLEKPLANPAAISRRLAAVEELTQATVLRQSIGEQLGGIYDIERLMTRVVYGNATPRDIKALGYTIAKLPALKACLAGCASQNLRECESHIDLLDDISSLIDATIVDEPPITVKDGGVIKQGYHKELDELHYLCEHTKDIIASIEVEEREKTGIKNLKIGYNRVFGYYIEVTRSFQDKVPLEYIRKQTLSGCERYITEQLKELEQKVLEAQGKIIELETRLFEELRAVIAAQLHRIQTSATAIARLDVLYSFATVAVENNYCRPEVNLSDEISITDGRHPVVEQMLSGVPFVPNDLSLNRSDKQIAIITGPNMAGKSTYMRQVALIVLLAQAGSFVPAKSAQIGIVDGIYTRVGASDDLTAGQSTFMVEMSEMASILHHATAKSLLILDEIGRGTSTFDGMSIARAVIEYIADKKKMGAKTLFATHYHELTELENVIGSVKNFNIAVKKRGDDIIFLRKIISGGADDSYGIEVSKLAGIPDVIIKRAHQVLESLEEGREVEAPKARGKALAAEPQISFAAMGNSKIIDKLEMVDLNTITPIEALNTLYELKNML